MLRVPIAAQLWLHFVELYAALQQVTARFLVAGVHRGDVGGGQRICEDTHSRAPLPGCDEPGCPSLARDEVRRNDQDVLLNLADEAAQLLQQQVGLLTQHFLRQIVQRGNLTPVGFDLALLSVDPQRCCPHGFVIRVSVPGDECFQFLLGLGELFRRAAILVKGTDGEGGLAVPVNVKRIADLVYDRTHGQYVHVREIDQFVQREVLVADVAAADHGHQVVCSHGLVVHAPVQAQRIGQQSRGACIAERDGVEQLDGHVRVAVQQQKSLVVGGAEAQVVQQQAHAGTAFRSVQQFLQQNPARDVGMPDVILQIQ